MVLIKLTYTERMQEQDKLWDGEKEDLYIMETLMNEIIEEAKTKGFTGNAIIYDGEKEKITEIFENKKQLELARLGKIDSFGFGYCKPLINRVEEMLNNRRAILNRKQRLGYFSKMSKRQNWTNI